MDFIRLHGVTTFEAVDFMLALAGKGAAGLLVLMFAWQIRQTWGTLVALVVMAGAGYAAGLSAWAVCGLLFCALAPLAQIEALIRRRRRVEVREPRPLAGYQPEPGMKPPPSPQAPPPARIS